MSCHIVSGVCKRDKWDIYMLQYFTSLESIAFYVAISANVLHRFSHRNAYGKYIS